MDSSFFLTGSMLNCVKVRFVNVWYCCDMCMWIDIHNIIGGKL